MNPLVVFLVSILLGIFYYIKMKKWCIKSNIKGFVKYVFLIGTSFIVFVVSVFILVFVFHLSNNDGEEKYSCSAEAYVGKLSRSEFEKADINTAKKGKVMSAGAGILTVKNNKFSISLNASNDNKLLESPELKNTNNKKIKSAVSEMEVNGVNWVVTFNLVLYKAKPEAHMFRFSGNNPNFVDVDGVMLRQCTKIN